MGHIVIGRVSPWCYALHPDLPIVSTWGREERTQEIIKQEIQQMKRILTRTKGNDLDEYEIECGYRYEFAVKNFSAEKQVQKWKHYINWVMNR